MPGFFIMFTSPHDLQWHVFFIPFDLLPPDYFALTHSPAPGLYIFCFVASHNFMDVTLLLFCNLHETTRNYYSVIDQGVTIISTIGRFRNDSRKYFVGGFLKAHLRARNNLNLQISHPQNPLAILHLQSTASKSACNLFSAHEKLVLLTSPQNGIRKINHIIKVSAQKALKFSFHVSFNTIFIFVNRHLKFIYFVTIENVSLPSTSRTHLIGREKKSVSGLLA